MATIAIELQDRQLEYTRKAATREGVPVDAWLHRVLSQALDDEQTRSLDNLWGSWEDSRTADEIIADLEPTPEELQLDAQREARLQKLWDMFDRVQTDAETDPPERD